MSLCITQMGVLRPKERQRPTQSHPATTRVRGSSHPQHTLSFLFSWPQSQPQTVLPSLYHAPESLPL